MHSFRTLNLLTLYKVPFSQLCVAQLENSSEKDVLKIVGCGFIKPQKIQKNNLATLPFKLLLTVAAHCGMRFQKFTLGKTK